MLNFGRLSIF
uniref:Uncharacterized protein n=1 Tax=Rhizophora mucronata TaxID=61149 RepID=A0A2P2PSK3_RHIMU